MNPGHMRKVLEADYRCVFVRLLVHKDDAAKSLDHIHSGTYNGILDSDIEALGAEDLTEIVGHEQTCDDGYIDWESHPEPALAEPRQWVLLACVEKRGEGQRFFSTKHHADPADLWVCDNSGDTPDCTDDGPLRLDKTRNVDVGGMMGDAAYAMLPVIVEREEPVSTEVMSSRCGVSLRELLWLVRHGWVKPAQLEFSESLQPLIDLLKVKAL